MKKVKKLILLPIMSLALSGCSFSDFTNLFKGKEDQPAEEQPKEEQPKEEQPKEEQPKEEEKVVSIKLDKTSLSLKTEQTAQLTATYENGKGDVVWSSDDLAVATVSQTGLVTAVGEGTAKITASYYGVKAECSVEVVAPEVKVVQSISLSDSSLTLDLVTELSKSLTPIVVADEGVDTTVTWTSSDSSIASLSKASGAKDEAVTVNAAKVGTATITATCGGKTATCTVNVIERARYSLIGMSENENIVKFRENVLDEHDRFIGATSDIIEVGDDNPFVMKPTLQVFDEKTVSTVNESNWEYAYDYTIKMFDGSEFVEVDKTQYVVFNSSKCTFDFNVEAVGKTFELTVAPGGLTTAQASNPDYHSTVKVAVVKGYNVYDADHLAYFNDINFDQNARQEGMPTDRYDDINDSWKAFRESKQLNPTWVPDRILLQSNIKILRENLPDVFFWSAADGVEESQVGKMLDSSDLYCHTANGFTFNGNYFDVDTSELPLCGNIWGSDGITHATLFKVAEMRQDGSLDSSLTFKNCSYFGNAPRDNDENHAKGLIFFKVRNYYNNNPLVVNALFDNFNVTRAAISFYAEYGPTVTTVRHCKVTEGYANGIYLHMNGDLHFEGSEFRNFGGPIIVTGAKDGGRTMVGFHITTDPTTILDNWVTGNEPWFISTHANVAIPSIQGANALIQNFGKTFVVGENKLMNFIAVNRGQLPWLTFDGGLEGMSPVGFDANTPNIDTMTTEMAGGAMFFNTDDGGLIKLTNAPAITAPITANASYLDFCMYDSNFGYISMVYGLADNA